MGDLLDRAARPVLVCDRGSLNVPQHRPNDPRPWIPYCRLRATTGPERFGARVVTTRRLDDRQRAGGSPQVSPAAGLRSGGSRQIPGPSRRVPSNTVASAGDHERRRSAGQPRATRRADASPGGGEPGRARRRAISRQIPPTMNAPSQRVAAITTPSRARRRVGRPCASRRVSAPRGSTKSSTPHASRPRTRSRSARCGTYGRWLGSIGA